MPHDYIAKYLEAGLETPDTLESKEIGDEIILYGISKNLIPFVNGTGILFIESDNEYAKKQCTVHVMIDKTNSLSKILEEGVTNFLFNKPTFVRGHVAGKRKVNNNGVEKTEILVKPSHDMRVVL